MEGQPNSKRQMRRITAGFGRINVQFGGGGPQEEEWMHFRLGFHAAKRRRRAWDDSRPTLLSVYLITRVIWSNLSNVVQLITAFLSRLRHVNIVNLSYITKTMNRILLRFCIVRIPLALAAGLVYHSNYLKTAIKTYCTFQFVAKYVCNPLLANDIHATTLFEMSIA